VQLPSSNLLIHESRYWNVYLFSADQRYLGRSVVGLKRHSPSLADLTRGEWDDLQAVIRVMENAARKLFGAAGFNWSCLMNNAFKRDPPKPHVHLHFLPRYRAPVKFQGMLFEDLLFGNHYDQSRVAVSPEVAVAIATALRAEVKTAGR
jgi:diadenosine tetraphosphate (Ap4A) HIT family hydrolase